MSPDATKRAHLQEINVETAMKLVDACIAYSRAANPNGGATVVVVGPSGNIVGVDAHRRTDSEQLRLGVPEGEDGALHARSRRARS